MSKMMKIIGAVAVIYLMIDSYGASAIAYGTVINAAVNFVLLAVYARVKWKLLFKSIMELPRVSWGNFFHSFLHSSAESLNKDNYFQSSLFISQIIRYAE